MAETFAEQLGQALRQLWDSTFEGFSALGSAQAGSLYEGPQQNPMTFGQLFSALSQLNDPNPIFDDAFRSSLNAQIGAQISTGFYGETVEAPTAPATKAVGATASKEPPAAPNLESLIGYLSSSERRFYDQLTYEDGLEYLKGKQSALITRMNADLESDTRHEDRFDQMNQGAGATSQSDPFADFLSGLLDSLFGGGGGGGGGGGAGRIYQGPDPAAVRDQIRLMMVALVGKADDQLIDEMVNTFLAQDRSRVMDGASIDPAQTVRDRIRATEQYQRIHKLRPQGVAEEDWLPVYRQVLTAAGIPMTTIDELAIKYAQAGLNPASFTAEGFDARAMQETGVAGPSLQDNASRVGRSIGALIR